MATETASEKERLKMRRNLMCQEALAVVMTMLRVNGTALERAGAF